MMAGLSDDIAAVCPKCRCLWQVNDEPDGILETWHAEAGDMLAHWAAPEQIPLSEPKCESTRTVTARRQRTWKFGLLV